MPLLSNRCDWPRWLILALSCGVLVGCSSTSHYVSPRLSGQVLDMESRQPIRDVRVHRVASGENARPAGGQLLDSPSAVRTGADGRFVLKSIRTLGPLGASGWYSVIVAFERSGYQSVVRSYTLANATNGPSGEPLVDAGEVLLPATRK